MPVDRLEKGRYFMGMQRGFTIALEAFTCAIVLAARARFVGKEITRRALPSRRATARKLPLRQATNRKRVI